MTVAPAPHGSTLALLRASDVLCGVDDAALLELEMYLRPVSFGTGEGIVREGEPADCWYLIVDGSAAVTHTDLGGEPVTLAVLGPGDSFGERALVSNGQRRSASVSALTAVQALALDSSDFRRVVQDAPDVADRVGRRLQLMAADTALKRASPFAGLPHEVVWSLAEQLQECVVKAGEIIVREGEPGDRFYLIRAGTVEVVRAGRRVARLGEGDSFGEVALLAETPRIATVRALEDTELLALTRDAFQQVTHEQTTAANFFRELVGVRFRGAGGQRLLLPDPVATIMPQVSPRRRKRYWLVLLIGVVLFGLATLAAVSSDSLAAIYLALVVGSLIGPVVFVYFLWESNILTERPLELVVTALLGAGLGLPTAIWFQREAGLIPGALVSVLLIALIEEVAKVCGVVWLLPRPALRFRMDGVIYGAAAGMGFAAIESAMYAFARVDSMGGLISVLWFRALLSPFTHGTWTAIVCSTIWRERHSGWRRAGLRIGGALVIVVLLHALWDWRGLPLPWNFVWLLLVGATSVMTLRWVLQQAATEEARSVSALAPEIARAAPTARALQCTGCGRRAPAGARYCPRCGLALRFR